MNRFIDDLRIKGKNMNKLLVFTTVLVFSICQVTGLFAQEKQEETKSKASTSVQKPKTVKERVITSTATVEAIDLKNRLVTLKGKNGTAMDLKVSENVKNLAQVKVGDLVTAKYYESIAIELADPGTSMQIGKSESVTKAKTGKKPSGVQASVLSVVANIESIDFKAHVATLKGPEGKIVTVTIRDTEKWSSAKVGDKVRITYTEALAIDVRPVNNK